MERPFDPTLKTLAELAPADWLVLANRRRRRVTVQDSIWEIPVEQLLRGGTGTLALAPISNLGTSDVRSVMRRMKERLNGPRAERLAADIWAATYVLLGLRYSDQLADALFEEILGMEQTTTYQAIVRRGRTEEALRVLFLLGETKFGPPDPATRAALEATTDIGQLEALAVRLMSADSWQKLLAPRRRNGRRKAGS